MQIDNNILYSLCLWIIPLLFAMAFHELSHAWVAYQLGDDTGKRLNRITLNPLSHIDPFGSILLPVCTYLSTGVTLGFAKPVPVDIRNLKNLRLDLALVAIAGPAANFIMAIAWCFVLKYFGGGVAQMARVGIVLNINLGLLNLLPLPGFDGSKVLAYFLPDNIAEAFRSLEPYAMLIFIAASSLGAISVVISPMTCAMVQNLVKIFGL